jgi:hypothetical protein
MIFSRSLAGAAGWLAEARADFLGDLLAGLRAMTELL